ncbi:MAG: hypothetical protein ACM34K_11530 [Bacillota bacterium]
MLNKILPEKQWDELLKEFSRKHKKWLVNLETEKENFHESLGLQLPLDKISLCESKNGKHEIEIVLKNARKSQANYKIKNIKSLELERDNIGADKALHFISEDGTRTILKFHSAALPETVDGII